MHIVKYLEHNGERFVVGDRVIIKGYGYPKIEGTIETFGNHEFYHILELQTDDGRLVKIDVEQVAEIWKLPRKNKMLADIEENRTKKGGSWMLNICTCDNCEYHEEFYDEVDGKTYHDGCICNNKNANIQELHMLCCNSLEPCPYKKEQSKN